MTRLIDRFRSIPMPLPTGGSVHSAPMFSLDMPMALTR